MTLRRNKRIDNQEPLKVWVWTLILVLLLGFVSYGYLVRGTIVNIVARQNMETELSALNSKVSDLEAEYIKAQNNITPELAAGLGFVSVVNQKFVMKTADRAGLSLVTSGN